MRLANGIIIDKEKTFGVLKFSALRREVHIQNEDGTVSEEIKERTYDLKCKEQGRMIQVSIPATVPLKEKNMIITQKWKSSILWLIRWQLLRFKEQTLTGASRQMILS